MDIKFRKETILPALQSVISVVDRRQTLAILGNILIEALSDKVVLTATDLEVELETSFVADIQEPGKITLPAKKFLDVIKNLDEGADITLNLKGDKGIVRAEKSRYLFSTLPANIFPGVDEIIKPVTFNISQSQLKKLIDSTQFCMAIQDVRYYLNGVLLEFCHNSIRAVSTDGHRLALAEINLNVPFTEPHQIIVPRKGVLELFRLLEDNENMIAITLGLNHISVVLPDVKFISKLIDGNYPAYRKVIPEPILSTSVEKETFRKALLRASVVSNVKVRAARLSIEQDSLIIQTENQENEEAKEEISCNYLGEKIDVAFNIGYLLDSLNVLSGDSINISFAISNGSCLISEIDDSRFKYVVMPMRI